MRKDKHFFSLVQNSLGEKTKNSLRRVNKKDLGKINNLHNSKMLHNFAAKFAIY